MWKEIRKAMLTFVLLASGSAAWAAFDLGAAGSYAVLQLGTTWNTSQAYIDGNVGINDSDPTIANTGVNNGDIFVSAPFSTALANKLGVIGAWTDPGLGSDPSVTGPFQGTIHYGYSLAQAAQDARAASANVANNTLFAPDQTFTQIKTTKASETTTITLGTPNTSHAGTYVIDINGELSLGNSGNLILDGTHLPAGAQVVVNVSGKFTINGASVVLAGGLENSQVLFNNTTTQAASITGGVLHGSFLGPNLNAAFNNNDGAVYGAVIADSIQFSSHFRVYGTGNLFVPEPATLISGALLLLPFGAGAL